MKNLKQQKQIICDITNRLFEVENIDADTIPNILLTYMTAVGCIDDSEDTELIETFVDSCNRKDLSILLVERLFDKAFNEPKEPTFEEVFNEGKEVKPINIFETLNGYFNFK